MRVRYFKLICLFLSMALVVSARMGEVHSSAQDSDELLAQKAAAILQSRGVQCHGAERAMITRLYELTLARKPQPVELKSSREFIRGH